MNVGESNDIAAVLSWITDRPRATGAPASTEEAREAAERLAERAYQTQMAGMRAEDVRRLWPTRDEQAHADLVELRGRADRYITRIQELARKHRRAVALRATLRELMRVQVRRAEEAIAERDAARAEAARHLGFLRQAHPRHFEVNVLGERLCGCVAQWPCREHVGLAEQVERVREMHGRPRTDRHGSGCIHCAIVWPCPTYLALTPEPKGQATE